MSSVYTDEISRSRISRRLSILPATIGMIGVALVPVGALAAGFTHAEWGWVVTAAVVSLVLATVMSGASFGLYLGLAILGVAGLRLGREPTALELTALALTMFAVHETVRFSLDARRPSRFGPGLIAGYLARSTATAALLVVATAVAWRLAQQTPGSSIWIPVGLAVAALPLFARRAAEQIDRVERLRSPMLRAAIASVGTLLVLAVVVIAARARTAIESAPRPGTSSPTPTTTIPPTTVPELVQTDPASLQRVLVFITVLTAVLVLGVLYLALRRPEALFELDELDADVEDRSFGIALPGQADQEDEIIQVDDQDLTDLLQNLQLDIAAERDPGRAIRFGYANIERSLADLQLTRDGSETEQEFLTRAMPTMGSAGPAMRSLTRLFERARFGHEAIDESMRQQALQAVVDLLDEVGRQTAPPIEAPNSSQAPSRPQPGPDNGPPGADR